MYSQAYYEGGDAYRTGLNGTANSYAAGTKENDEWWAGWSAEEAATRDRTFMGSGLPF